MLVVDVEMSGLEPEKSSIVSIGAVDFEHPERQFYRECRIWDGAEIDPEALAVNGFTAEQIVDPSRPTVQELVVEFVAWTRQASEQTIAGQNVAFDLSFIRASVKKHGIDWKAGYRNVDLHSVCWAHMARRGVPPPAKDGRTSLNLDSILPYVGLPTEPKPHNGLTGAKMEAEAFSRLIHGKQLLEDYKVHPVPDYLLS